MTSLATASALTSLAEAAQYGGYARAAMGLKDHFTQNKRTYKKAAKTIGRAYKQYSKKRKTSRHNNSTQNVGHAPGSDTGKRHHLTDAISGFRDTRTQYITNLTELPHQDTHGVQFRIDERNRQIAHIKGFKICMEVSNQRPDPVYWNWAIVVPKLTVTNTFPTDFFRGNAETRGQDFDNT
jgi:hypothetical protein